MNKPVNEKRANAARLRLWMYVLAWLLRTTRLAEHDVNATPIHGSEATATGDDSPVKERTLLELYSKIIDAYQNAGKLLENKIFILIRLFTLLVAFVAFVLFYYFLSIFSIFSIMLIPIYLFIVFILDFIYNRIIANRLEHDAMLKYGGLIRRIGLDPTSAPHEIYRYFLFRKKLREYNISAEDVKSVIPLLKSEYETLGSYVAQHPLHVWIASTLTAVLAASATTWHFKFVVVVVFIGIFVLIVLWAFQLFVGVHRRQYELRRWLTWYEADDSGTVVDPDPGSTNSLPD